MTRDEEYEVARRLSIRADQYMRLLALKAPEILLASQRGLLRETFMKMPPPTLDEQEMDEMRSFEQVQGDLLDQTDISHLDFAVTDDEALS